MVSVNDVNVFFSFCLTECLFEIFFFIFIFQRQIIIGLKSLICDPWFIVVVVVEKKNIDKNIHEIKYKKKKPSRNKTMTIHWPVFFVISTLTHTGTHTNTHTLINIAPGNCIRYIQGLCHHHHHHHHNHNDVIIIIIMYFSFHFHFDFFLPFK